MSRDFHNAKGFRHEPSNDEKANFHSDGIKRAKSRRWLKERQEAYAEEVAAMLFLGDEPTGDLEVMTKIEIFTRNKAFRQSFFDAPEGERMYEWRFVSKARKSNRERRERNQAAWKAAPYGGEK